jgi:tRNA (cmo5U34)-methyltransferase
VSWQPDTYLDEIRVEIPRYDELQERVVAATGGLRVSRILELGVGTGETTRRLLDTHPLAAVVGIDGSADMLAAARANLPAVRVALRLARLEDTLPGGRFDLVVSVLAVHHLTGDEKAALFERVGAILVPGGRFVLGDVVVPEDPKDAVIPVEEGFDLPDRVDDQVSWLAAARFNPQIVWRWKDLAVVSADLQA